MPRKSRTSLRLSAFLKKVIEDFDAKDGVSVNQYIALAVAKKIGWRGAAEFFAQRGKNGDVERAIAFLESRPEEA